MKFLSKLFSWMNLELGCLIIGALEYSYGWFLFSHVLLFILEISLGHIKALIPDFGIITGIGLLFVLHGFLLIVAILESKRILLIVWLVCAVILAILCLVAVILRAKICIAFIVTMAIIKFITFIYMFAVVLLYYIKERRGKDGSLTKQTVK